MHMDLQSHMVQGSFGHQMQIFKSLIWKTLSMKTSSSQTIWEVKFSMESIQVLELIAHVTSLLSYSVWCSFHQVKKFGLMRMGRKSSLSIPKAKEHQLWIVKQSSKQSPLRMLLLKMILNYSLTKLRRLMYWLTRYKSTSAISEWNLKFGEDIYHPTTYVSLQVI